MEFNSFIGDRISEIRRKKNISQESLANRAGIDRTYMSSIERGRRSISFCVAIKLSTALEINLINLIEKDDGTYINGFDL